MGGVYTLLDYLAAHVLLCLVPAFFIAGALNAFVDKESVTKYIGSKTKKYISYPFAAVAGLLIAVCSCTILPLFAGIWKKGAGLGPAVTFLFAGPAVNILALTYTGTLIGMDIAIARAVLSIVFAIGIGMMMTLLFRDTMKVPNNAPQGNPGGTPGELSGNPTEGQTAAIGQSIIRQVDERSWADAHRVGFFFVFLVLVLLIGTAPIPQSWKAPLLIGDLIVLGIVLVRWFSKREVDNWLRETKFFVKLIFPLLLVGIFGVGVAKVLIPEELVGQYLGENTLAANLFGVLFGVFMYFPTLVEVPIARMFLDLGMAKGPLLAYLLADPELSLQSILVTRKIMGDRKNVTYVILVTIACTCAGLIFGYFVT
ncbi:MAG: permease [Candidatus Heimdallarchaeota archaeon]